MKDNTTLFLNQTYITTMFYDMVQSKIALAFFAVKSHCKVNFFISLFALHFLQHYCFPLNNSILDYLSSASIASIFQGESHYISYPCLQSRFASLICLHQSFLPFPNLVSSMIFVKCATYSLIQIINEVSVRPDQILILVIYHQTLTQNSVHCLLLSPFLFCPSTSF